MKTKICSKCGLELDICMFSKKASSKDGLQPLCKICAKEFHKKYYKEHLDEAKENNKKYREENPEKVHENNVRYRKNNPDKIKETNRKYHEEHSDIVAARHKKFYKENSEEVKSNRRNYYKDNSVKDREWHKQYAKDNPEKCRMNNQKRRARKLLLPNTFIIGQWENAKSYFNNCCCYCGKELPLEQEHFIPITKNGGFTKGNIIPACRSCNSSKNDKDFKDWYPKHKSYDKGREKIIIEYIEYNNI